MGVIKRGILGGFSGRVANVVGSSWKGIAYMKSLPLSVANPQTAGQTTQRNAFTAAVFAATSTLTTWIKPLWDRFAQQMSGYNDFVSRNVEFFVDGVLTVPSSLKASVGILFVSPILDLSASVGTGHIDIELSTANGTNGAATDDVYILVFNSTKTTWKGYSNVTTRSVGNFFVADATMEVGDELDVWASFRKADGTIVSNSVYDTTVVGA